MKKILNIFASITLITTGASSVVACGSDHNPNPTPPKSEIQQLFDELNNQTFTIQDQNFWGNEANYQQDLKTDLEKVAHINPQYDNDLSLNSDLKILDQPGKYTFLVSIGTGEAEKTANVTIDWKLTPAQSVRGLFDFYTKTWPKDFQTYQQFDEGIGITKLFLSVWDKTTKNWSQDLKNSLTWSDFTKDLLNEVFLEKSSFFLIPSELQPYFHIQSDVGFDSLNVNQYKQVKNPFYFQKSAGDPKIYLPYYDYSPYTPFSPQKPLPKANQSWTVGYNTDYNLLKNKLKTYTTKQKPLQASQSFFHKDPAGQYKDKYYVDDTDAYQGIHRHNEGEIKERLDGWFEQIDLDLTLKGQLIPNQASPIEFYYKGIDQGFPIYVDIYKF